MSAVAETFGQMIERGMKAAGLRAYELAFKLGKQPSYVSRIVNDEYKGTPPPNELAILQEELGMSQLAMLAALGYDVSEGDGFKMPADHRLMELASEWDKLTHPEKELIFELLEANRKRRRVLDQLDTPGDGPRIKLSM